MLVELAAANAAFNVIKAALANGKELSDLGSKVFDYFDNKSKIQEKANKKAGGRPTEGRTDMEEFMALEQLKAQEQDLRERMVYAGRPGLWEDWVKFQAMAARRRREAQEAAKRAALIRQRKREQFIEIAAVAVASLILAALLLYGVYLYVNYMPRK